MPKLDRPVYIMPEASEFLWTAIRAVKTEICGMGYLTRSPDNGPWVWYKTLLGPQEVSGGAADFTDPSFFIAQAIRDGVDLNDPNHSWVWWHSHNDMSAYWSSTDEEGVRTWRDQSGLPHVFSFVGNHKGDYRLRLDTFDHPLIDQITFDIEQLLIVPDPGITKAVDDGIKCFVVEKKYTPKVTKGQQPLPKASTRNLSDDLTEYVKLEDGKLIELNDSLCAILETQYGEEWYSDIEFDEKNDRLIMILKTQEELEHELTIAKAWDEYEQNQAAIAGAETTEANGHVY